VFLAKFADPAADVLPPVEHLLLKGGLFLHLCDDLLINLLAYARNGQNHGRPLLFEVREKRVDRLGIGNGNSAVHGVKMAGNPLKHMREGKKGHQDILIVGKRRLNRVQGFHNPENVSVGDHGALGQSGCAGGINEGGQIIDRHIPGKFLKEGGVFGVFFSSQFQQSPEAHDAGMPFGVLFLHHDDLFNTGALVDDFQRFFELAPVFRQNDLGLGIIENILDLIRNQRRIDRNHAGADSQRAHIGVNPFQPVFGKDGNHVPFSNPQGIKSHANGARPLVILIPGRAMPHAVHLLFNSKTVFVFLNAVPKNIVHGFFCCFHRTSPAEI